MWLYSSFVLEMLILEGEDMARSHMLRDKGCLLLGGLIFRVMLLVYVWLIDENYRQP